MDLNPNGDEVTRLVVDALLEAENEPAPAPLRGRVLAAALTARPPGRVAAAVAAAEVSPIEAYLRTVAELDDLLGSLRPEDWGAHVAPYGWDVQGLVGHLVAIERLLATRLGVDDLAMPAELEADHIAMTQPTVTAQQGRDPAATLADWRAAVAAVRGALQATPPDLDDRVPFHGVSYRWRSLLVARTLEVWTHSDDVRRAVGRPLAAPDEARLVLMTDLAVRTLPLRLAASGATAGATATATATMRIVLTGPGGGVWVQAFAPDAPAAETPDVRIVADAIGFCRLSAGRLATADLAATVSGDQSLADAVLAASAAFAL